MTAILVVGAVSLAIWIYLVIGRGGFWLAAVQGDEECAAPAVWPRIAAIVPARDEAVMIAQTLATLLAQDYPGPFQIILVDDQSGDGTAEVARTAARATNASDRLTVISGRPLPDGWSGKVWAMNQGAEQATMLPEPPDYLLLADADIAFDPGALRRLVARAQAQRLAVTSLMVKLRCESLAERALVPAFIYFYQLIYPFDWVKEPARRTATAAGGCLMVRREALQVVGGFAAIRNALIDDTSVAQLLKPHGPIWLGLTNRVTSIRPYRSFDSLRRMIARSACDQLNYSPLLLAGTILGLMLTFVAPPLLTLCASGVAQVFAGMAWALMSVSYLPVLWLYRLSPLWAPALPLIALVYAFFTLDSAYQHMRGKGGFWKGRAQARRPAGRWGRRFFS
jgi:hopene-associated glycosyltransferase HpnB